MILLRLIHGRIKTKRCSNAGMNIFLELLLVRTDYSAQKFLYNWGSNMLQIKVRRCVWLEWSIVVEFMSKNSGDFSTDGSFFKRSDS